MSERNIRVEGTPNPQAAKFVLDRRLSNDKGQAFFDAESAAADPLATRLFQVEGVRALLMVDNFITVTKAEDTEWPDIVDEVRKAILDVFEG